MAQIARNITDEVDRFFKGKRYLIHDRDPLCTQEFLSEMLGVRRPSVSLAASTLQHAGLINYRWGRITVLDRYGLEQAACEDYRQTVDEYEMTFKPLG